MDVARTTMIHAAAPHFLWPFAVQYAVHQMNLQPRVSLPETTPTLRWTGKVGDVSAFRVWGSRAFVRDTTADNLSSHAVPCVFLGFPPDASGWQLYHPTLRRVLSSQDVTFDESESTQPERVEPGGAEPRGAESGSAEPGGAEPTRAASGGPLGAAGAADAGVAGGAAGGTDAVGGPAGVGAAGGAGAADPGGVHTGGTKAAGAGGAAGAGAVTTGGASGAGAAGGTGAGGAAGVVAGDPGAEGTSAVSAFSGGVARTQPYYPTSPLLGPSPYSGPTRGLTKRHEPESRPVSPDSHPASPVSRSALPIRTIRAYRRVSRPRPPPVPGTHSMTLRPSIAPQRVPLPSLSASSLLDGPDPESDSL
ncbi:unnamed protein product [Closterium sp. NIES-54]